MICFALLLVPWIQDPDRSSPEKTVQAFVEFGDSLAPENLFIMLLKQVDEMQRFARTEEFHKKKAKEFEDLSEWLEQSKPISSKFEIVGRVDGKDGRVTVDSVKRVRKAKIDPQTRKKAGEEDQTLPYRHVVRKVGEVWMVEEVYEPCPLCGGAGTCRGCQGTGTAHARECFSCQGKKACSSCHGGKLRKRELVKEGGLELVEPDGEMTFSKDLSTAKASAQTLLDLSIRGALEWSALLKTFVERVLVPFRLFVVPETVKKFEERFAAEKVEGKERFRKNRPRLESVEERDGQAYVVIVTVGNWGRFIRSSDDKGEHRTRYVLKQVETRWFLDAEHHPCWGCRETPGKCRSCKGTGKVGEQDCTGCKGSKQCSQCKGEGWRPR